MNSKVPKNIQRAGKQLSTQIRTIGNQIDLVDSIYKHSGVPKNYLSMLRQGLDLIDIEFFYNLQPSHQTSLAQHMPIDTTIKRAVVVTIQSELESPVYIAVLTKDSKVYLIDARLTDNGELDFTVTDNQNRKYRSSRRSHTDNFKTLEQLVTAYYYVHRMERLL